MTTRDFLMQLVLVVAPELVRGVVNEARIRRPRPAAAEGSFAAYARARRAA